MGTITFGLSGSGIVNGSKTFTISDADTTRLLNWATVRFAQTNAQGQVVAQTNGQLLVDWANAVMAYTADQIRQFEANNAAATASNGVVPPSIA